MESIGFAGIGILFGCYKAIKLINRKKYKGKLKKSLIIAFNELDINKIRKSIKGLKDYDSKYNTQKLGKYIENIIELINNNDEPININPVNMEKALEDLDMLPTIFDNPEEDIKEANLLDEKITEIEKKRKEIILRKNLLKLNMVKAQKHKSKSSGKMG